MQKTKAMNKLFNLSIAIPLAFLCAQGCREKGGEQPNVPGESPSGVDVRCVSEKNTGSSLANAAETKVAGEVPDPSPPCPDMATRHPLPPTGQVTAPEPFPPYARRVVERLRPEFEGLKNGDPRLREKFRRLWKSAWVGSFDGNTLPGEGVDLARLRSDGGKFVSDLQSGKLVLPGGEEELEAAYTMLALAAGDGQSGGQNLMDVLVARSVDQNIKRGDVVIYHIAKESLCTEYDKPEASLACLGKMSESDNPIYRMLAAELGSRLVSGGNELAVYYKRFKNEENPDVLAGVISGLRKSGRSQALELLGRIIKSARSRGDSLTVNLARKAQEDLQNRKVSIP